VTVTGSPPKPRAPGTATRTTTRRRDLATETGIVALLALIVAVVTTWPLLRDAGHVAHDPFDPAFQAWTIDWVQHALHHPLHLFDANIFAPESNTLAYSDSLIGIAVPLLPLRWIGLSPIAQVNVALLLGTATSAAAAYLFGRYVSGFRAVGALTAVAFAFGPFGTLSSGALHATVKAGIPLAALAAWWLADRAERALPLWPPVLLLVAVTTWQLSVSFYPGAYTIAAAIVVLLVRARSLGRRGWLAALGGLALCGVAAGLLAVPYLSVRESFPSFGRELTNLGPLGADFLHTDPRLSVWGDLLGRGSGWPVYGEPAFPGVVLLILGLVGLAAAWRGDGSARRVALVAVALITIGALLGLGTAATGWRAWSPYRILFEFVPGWRALRATGRGWAVGLLGLGLLAGYGVCSLARAITHRTTARPARVLGVVAVLAVGCVLVEGHAKWGDALVTVRASSADRALAEIAGPGGVLYLPALEPREPARPFSGFRQAANVYGTTEHHRRTPNGYSGFFPPSWVRTSRIAEDLPNREAITRIRALGVRYVIVRSWARGGTWEPLLDPANAAPLRLVGEFDGDLLYEMPGP
jgi:hypothetical protein